MDESAAALTQASRMWIYKPIVFPYSGPTYDVLDPLIPAPPPRWPTSFEYAAMVAQNDISITEVPELDEMQTAIFTKSLWLLSISDAEYANEVDVPATKAQWLASSVDGSSCAPRKTPREQPRKTPPPKSLSPRPPTQAPPAHLLPTSEREATRMRVRHRIRKFKSTRAQ